MSQDGLSVTSELYALALGPHFAPQTYPCCVVNGVKFISRQRDSRRTTQNSGVCVPSEGGHDFYGQVENVIVLTYQNDCHVVLFQCRWFGDQDPRKRTRNDNNLTSVYVAKEWYKDEPFILATQAKQVFYLEDNLNGPDWRIVEECNHRNVWDLPDIDLILGQSSSSVQLSVEPSDLDSLSTRHQSAIPEPVSNDAVNLLENIEEEEFIDDEETEDEELMEEDDLSDDDD